MLCVWLLVTVNAIQFVLKNPLDYGKFKRSSRRCRRKRRRRTVNPTRKPSLIKFEERWAT